MQQLLEYLGHHPFLAGEAALAIVIVAIYEMRANAHSFAALSSMQAVRLMNQGALVIDVRGKAAYDAGHIGDARNVPAAALEAQAEALKKWRDKAVIAYCDTGREAATAVHQLQKLGFTKVFNLQGGLSAWIKDNMPVTRAAGSGDQIAT